MVFGFVPDARIFYRVSGSGSLSDFDESEKKLDVAVSFRATTRRLSSLFGK